MPFNFLNQQKNWLFCKPVFKVDAESVDTIEVLTAIIKTCTILVHIRVVLWQKYPFECVPYIRVCELPICFKLCLNFSSAGTAFPKPSSGDDHHEIQRSDVESIFGFLKIFFFVKYFY